MNRLFIELYLDEDVDVLVADLLQARGFVATTARDEGLLQKSDEEQLEYAVTLKRAFLTHNREDFETLAESHQNEGRQHYGIILSVRYSPYEIVRRLLRILNHVTADEIEGAVRYI